MGEKIKRVFERSETKTIGLLLMFFTLFKPEAIWYLFQPIDVILDCGRVITYVYVISLIVRKKCKFSKIEYAIIAYLICLAIPAFIFKTNLLMLAINTASFGSVIVLVNVYSKDFKIMINSLMLNFEVLIYGCLFSYILFYPGGMYKKDTGSTSQHYFLGNRNAVIFYVLTGLCVAALYYAKTKDKVRPSILVASSIACILYTHSSTSLIALTSFILLFIFQHCVFKKTVSCKWILPLYVLFDYLICIKQVFNTVSFVQNFIVSILHKSITYSGRTEIWMEAMKTIKNHFWIGLGQGTHLLVGKYEYSGHNQIFESMLEGGIIALIVFAVLLVIVLFQIAKSKCSIQKMVFICAFVALMIEYIFEARFSVEVVLFFSLVNLLHNKEIVSDSL